MNDRLWHVAENGKADGPFSTEDVLSRIADGSITSDAYIFKAGTHEWVPITERKEFFEQFSAIPPPPPPPARHAGHPAQPEQSTSASHEHGDQKPTQTNATGTRKQSTHRFRRLTARLVLAGALGVGVFYASKGSVGAAGIAAALGLALGASPAGWVSMAVGVVGLKVAYESYEPKPHCIYYSSSKVVGSIDTLSNQCYTDRKECMDAVPFHAASGQGKYVGCWDTCQNLSTYDCKIRTLMEGHRAR